MKLPALEVRLLLIMLHAVIHPQIEAGAKEKEGGSSKIVNYLINPQLI